MLVLLLASIYSLSLPFKTIEKNKKNKTIFIADANIARISTTILKNNFFFIVFYIIVL